MKRHIGASVYLRDFFPDVQRLIYFIIKVIVDVTKRKKRKKILYHRMVSCVAGRYMLKIEKFPESCSLTLVAKCLLFCEYRYGSYHKNLQKDE